MRKLLHYAIICVKVCNKNLLQTDKKNKKKKKKKLENNRKKVAKNRRIDRNKCLLLFYSASFSPSFKHTLREKRDREKEQSIQVK